MIKRKNFDEIEEKKKLIAKVVLAIGICIIAITCYIKNRIDENSYNNIYENFELENNVILANTAPENLQAQEEKIKVYVTGAVNAPGVIELVLGARIEDAINLAGGVREDANLEEVNLAYCLEDGQKLYIPNINEKEVEYLTEQNGEKVIEETPNQSSSKVNINTGGIEELKSLPGVGESLAQKIIDYRNENGKFKTVEDLRSVSGIGDKKFESMKDYIVIK